MTNFTFIPFFFFFFNKFVKIVMFNSALEKKKSNQIN
jgi:hypothetical protein